MITEEEAQKQLETLHAEGSALAKAFLEEEEGESFEEGYQRWYSRALPLMKQLALDRYAEFQSFYVVDPRFGWYNSGAYVIQDYFRGRDSEDAAEETARCFGNQLAILKSISDRLTWSQMDTAEQAERGLQLAFLETARDLISIDARAAGALAGTVLGDYSRSSPPNTDSSSASRPRCSGNI